jgi:hypothetical protein
VFKEGKAMSEKSECVTYNYSKHRIKDTPVEKQIQ